MAPARHLFFGMLLTAAAGFIDAVGFMELGGYFVSFMSGNTTQGGAALVEGAFPVFGMTMALVALFFAGSVMGAALAFCSTRWGPAAVSGAVFLGVGITVALVLSGVPANLAMLVLAASAGAQNAILPMRSTVRLGATFVTGTLYTSGQELALALQGKVPPWRWLQHLAIWFGLLGGATAGALVYRAFGIHALYIPIVIYAGFTMGHFWAARRSGDHA